MNKPPFCTSYDEARQIFQEGELQAWDGTRWVDIPKDHTPFFSRRVEEYRRRPRPAEMVPAYYTVYDTSKPEERRVCCFESGHAVASYLWGKDLKTISVFKRIEITSLDIDEIEKLLDRA